MADTDNLNEELRTYKPHFRWGKYGRDALVFILDAFLLFVASLIVFAFLLYVILQGRIDISSFSASNWVDIVGHVAWPLLVFITVFLLRNPLRQLIYEAEGFIGRSYIRQGTLFVPASSQNSQPVCGAETKESRSVKEKAIRFLEEQYGFEILRKRSLKGGRYSFDGVVRLNGITYCIAIKHSKDKTPQYFSRDEMNEVMGKVRGDSRNTQRLCFYDLHSCT